MKKIIALLLLATFAASAAFAAPFQPTLLTLTYEDIIKYEFDGSSIDIPFTVNGTNAGVVFSVFTKDKADEIALTTNGYLGWHTVNKVDTCIYFSDLKTVQVGSNSITWDGKDLDGGTVAAGTYTYYLWAFDNQGTKQSVGEKLLSGWGYDMQTNVQEVDETGLPMAAPIWHWTTSDKLHRWTIGSDPADETQLIRTDLNLAQNWEVIGDSVLDMNDFEYQYVRVNNKSANLGSVQKIKFVAGGESSPVEDWGDLAPFGYQFSTVGGDGAGIASDGNYLFANDENHTESVDPDSDFYIYDMEGFLVEEIDISIWWSSPEDAGNDGQMNGGPNNFECRNGKVVLNCHCNCLNQMLDPARYLESSEIDDLLVWTNDNGDYTLDHNWEETADKTWVCNDYNVGPYKYCVSTDANLFTAVCSYDVGTTSFGLFAPDGTGMGFYSFAGETAGQKKGEIFIDSGTPFDGLYTDNEHTGGHHTESCADTRVLGIFYLGHDSVSGVITNVVAVEDAAPAAFAVDQNSPNPFNPTTTINFSLASAGDVSVDVFNVAGQKVDTLVDGFQSAGSHSVVWDASDFSAGVYFYTVKSGSMSKTMKMTLIK